MTRYSRLVALLLCISMLISLAACNSQPEQSTPETIAPTEAPVPTETLAPTEPEPDARELYEQSREALLSAQHLTLNITDHTDYTVADTEFGYDRALVLQIAGQGTDAARIKVSEEINGNDFEDSFDDCYIDGTLYTRVYDQYLFQGQISQEDYLAQFAPAAVLDSSLYGQITSEPISGGSLLTFSDPTGPETWAVPEDAQFETASGTAMLTSDGALEYSTYTVIYKQGPAMVTQTVQVTPTVEETLTIEAPADPEAYKQLDWILGPRAYDLSMLPMFFCNSVSTALTETIISEAAGCVYTVQNTVDYTGSGKELTAKVDYSVSLNQSGTTDQYAQSEVFLDSAYTLTADGADPQSMEVTPEQMLEYVQGYLWENIVSLTYFENVTVSQVGGLLYLEVTFTEEYGSYLNEYVNSRLFNDEQFLNNLASGYSNTECTGYLAINPSTGFPTATGITYQGIHTIEGDDYALTLQADQSFDLASLSAYEAVTGEPAPEEEPEAKATPLFYHVTGTDGEEMWLFGTIHVGDERTGFLPQEIYDALNASDALAVEFDIQEFESKVDNDAKLAQQIALCYFYSDGSATKDHLDEEIYADAVKLLKASGSYNANAEYFRPYLWSQSIENFYIQLGYDLISEKGVDNRLLDLAKASGMKILDIESGLSQVQMLTGFSPELQEALLEDTLYTTADLYCADVAQLYELWCAGDEAALYEALSDEVVLSELTEEDQAEYEQYKDLIDEYNQAMSYNRNKQMLEVAIEYLESGDTVFYAVGLAHLLNNVNGLVDALRDAGYTVELVTFQ